MTIQGVMFGYLTMSGICMEAIAFGSYFYVIASIKCLKENLFAIKASSRDRAKRKLIRRQLIEFIEFNSRAKQLSHLIYHRIIR